MAAIQSELEFRRQRAVQYTVAVIGAIVVSASVDSQCSRSGRANTNARSSLIAGFFGDIPSTASEIDDKLPYNSR